MAVSPTQIVELLAATDDPDIGYVVGVVSPDFPDGLVSCSPRQVALQGGGQAAITSSTLFEIGSVSKVFTAGMVQQQVSADFSGTLGDHVPVAVGNALGWVAELSLRDIAVYSSGMPSDNGECKDDNPLPYWMVQKLDELITYVGAHYGGFSAFSSSPPGQWYTYSNLSWDWMGLTVAGSFLPDQGHKFCDNYQSQLNTYCNLFPLPSTAPAEVTGYWSLTAAQIEVMPCGHIAPLKPKNAPPVTRAQTPDGGLVSNGESMLAFLQYAMSPQYPTFMQTPVQSGDNVCSEGTTTTGYGWFVNKDIDAGVECIWKDGGVTGFTSLVIMEPRQNPETACPSGVFVLSNGPDAIAKGVDVFNIIKTTDGPVPDLQRSGR